MGVFWETISKSSMKVHIFFATMSLLLWVYFLAIVNTKTIHSIKSIYYFSSGNLSNKFTKYFVSF